MQTISLKSNSPDAVIPLLMNAIIREKRILLASIKAIKVKINCLSGSLGIDIDMLMKGKVKHTESNEMQLIELEGKIDILKHLESELNELESIEICK